MGKWEKFADELEEEDALTKAPEFQDMVVDMVDPADATLPPEIRGCQVIERRHPGGGVEVFYCRPDGVTYFEAQATELIEAFRAASGGGAPAASVPVPGGPMPEVNIPGVTAPGAPAEAPAAEAPAADVVIDTLGSGDDVPRQLHGAQLVDRGGDFYFITSGGEAIPKEIGDGLFEAFESPEVTNPGLEVPAAAPEPVPVPTPQSQAAAAPAETVIDTLGTGDDVPPRLRGANLLERGGSFFFVVPDGEAIPKEIGDDLFEAWEAPTPGEAEAPPPEAKAAPEAEGTPEAEDAPEAEAAPETEAAPEAAPEAPAEQSATAVEEEIIEFLGGGEDVPPRLRSGRLVRRVDGFYYVTADDEVIPAEIGEDLMDAWNPEDGATAEAPGEAPVAGAMAATADGAHGPLQKPFGFGDFGPVTVPDANVPETIDVQVPAAEAPATELAATKATAEGAAAADAATADAATEALPARSKLEAGRLEDQLADAVTTVRREAATGGLDVGDATPTADQLAAMVSEHVAADPADAKLARMLRRSEQLTEQITEAWAGDENRGRQALHRDVVSGTLLLAAVNPTQLKDLDVLGLVTLLRLRAAEGGDRVVGELATSLRTKLVEDLSRAIKASSFTDQVLQGARSTAGVVTAGQLWPEGVTHLVAQTVARQISHTVGEVLGYFREQGFAFPGLAEKVLEAYGHFATDMGERVARAIAP